MQIPTRTRVIVNSIPFEIRTGMATVMLFGQSALMCAAVIVQTFEKPLAPNTKGHINDMGPGYIIDGIEHRAWWLPAPAPLDVDGNGTTDLTIGGTGRGETIVAMYVTQTGRNQVWSRAGGFEGLDIGSDAIALIGGTQIGPDLSSPNPLIGWHNDDDTGYYSTLAWALGAGGGSPQGGDFIASYAFEPKYLGVRFEKEGRLHYGWVCLSDSFYVAEQIWIYQWAFESEPETGLRVGQVPEPSAALLLLATPLLFAARRNRRSSLLLGGSFFRPPVSTRS